MNILAIDTSQRDLSLAIAKDEKIIRFRNVKFKKDISERLTLYIDSLIKDASISLAELDGIVVGLGPGSFTGLRISLAAVKALSYSLKIPVVGVPSLGAIALGLNEKARDICVLIDAKRDLFYSSVYNHANGDLKQKGKISLDTLEDALKKVRTDTVFVGDGISIAREDILSKTKTKASFAKEAAWRPQAKYLVPLALKRFRSNETDDPEKLIPIYLYPKDCQVINK